MIRRGEIWWADLGEPRGSVAGFRRPVVIVQADTVNDSRIDTVLVVPLTGQLRWADVSTCLRLPAKVTGLHKDSVAQTSLLMAIDKMFVIERIGALSPRQLDQLFRCLDIALGR